MSLLKPAFLVLAVAGAGLQTHQIHLPPKLQQPVDRYLSELHLHQQQTGHSVSCRIQAGRALRDENIDALESLRNHCAMTAPTPDASLDP